MISIALNIWRSVVSGAVGGPPLVAGQFSLDLSVDGNLMFG